MKEALFTPDMLTNPVLLPFKSDATAPTGPSDPVKERVCFGVDKSFEKRNYPPGQHGNNRRRPKKSEYAVQLMEKQKAKYTYGILERQFRNIFKKASSSKGVTGEVLLQLCESRLDNVIYRLGISSSRSGARQLVAHKHVTVDGKIVNIPSYTLKPGQIVGIREKSKSLKTIISSLEANNSVYDWLTWNGDTFEGTFINQPERSQIPETIKEQLIVELYSK